jgi:hypothetical protein
MPRIVYGKGPMTAFFVPDTPVGEQTRRAYEDLRRHVELTVGQPPRSPRIFKLSCRRGGADRETVVGAHGWAGPEVVHAIFDIGDGYVVLWRGGHEVLSKRQTYSTVEFD